MQASTHRHGDDGEQGADDERDAPAPRAELRGGEEDLLEQQQHENRAELSADERHVLKARIEPAVLRVGDFGQVGRARAVFAADTETLHQARQQ